MDSAVGPWLRRAPGFQEAFPGEVPAEIRSTTRFGPLFLALIAVMLLLPVEIIVVIVVRSDILLSILSTVFIFLFFPLAYRIMSLQSKTGPLMAWFSLRTEQVWVKVDEEYFVVRFPGKREAYEPSKLDWVNDTTFNVWEGEIRFQLAFESTSDASRIATLVKNKFLTSSSKLASEH
jgi:hypothetical protein